MTTLIFTVLLFIVISGALISVFFFNAAYIMFFIAAGLGLISFLGLTDKLGTGK